MSKAAFAFVVPLAALALAVACSPSAPNRGATGNTTGMGTETGTGTVVGPGASRPSGSVMTSPPSPRSSPEETAPAPVR